MPRHRMRPLAGVLLATLLAVHAAFIPAAHASKPKVAPKKAAAEVVYITDTGKKYHSAGCRYLKSSSHAITLEEAKKSYEPCKVCRGGE